MKIVNYKQYKKKQQSPGWFLLFWVGIILGGFVVWWNKERFVQDSYFLGEEVFKRFGYTSIYKDCFFYYIFRNRFELFVFIILSSFTSFMTSIFYFFVFWVGLCGGIITFTLFLKFGLKGLLLLFGLVFPHMLIYVPCFVVLMKLLYQFHNIGVGRNKMSSEFKSTLKQPIPIFCVAILCLGAIIVAGVLLESYVNPIILKKITSFLW